MSEIIACRACLAVDTTLYRIDDMYTLEVYQHLTNITFQSVDGKPQLLCYECNAHMKRCIYFRDRCLRADGVLNQWLLCDMGQIQESITMFDRKLYNLNSLCSVNKVQNVNINGGLTIEPDELKTELDLVKDTEIQDSCEVKNEIDYDDIDNNSGSYQQNDDFKIEKESDSEDDLPLLSLQQITKKKKLKPIKKMERSDKVDIKKGFKGEYAKELILTREEQLAEMNARRTSTCYLKATFQCTLCFKGFVDQQAYDNHMEKHDKKNGEFECDICMLRYESDRQLRAHTYTVHCRRYVCVQCGHRSQTAHQARAHERWHRGHKYECKLCGQTFSKPTTHLSHLRKSHPTEHNCELCGDSFIGRQGLLLHKSKMHRHHDAKADEPEATRYCADCNILFVTSEAWKRHIITSLKHIIAMKNSDVCGICGSRFATNTELITHMKKHKMQKTRNKYSKGLKSNTCTKCNAEFADTTRLMRHINRMHSGVKPMRYYKSMVCEVCGKKCSSNASLKYHQRTHTGERPYPCTLCGKKFADSNQLRIHTRTHTDARPYTCQLCDKSFRQRPALNRHMRVHTGVKPYACSYCAKTFSQSNSVKLHIRTVHLKLPTSNRKKSQNALTVTTPLVQIGGVS